VTEPERPPERPDDLRYPDQRPLRRLQLATVALIAIAALVTLLSGSRPAEVRWGTLVGLLALMAVVLWATRRRRRTRAAAPDGRNPRNPGQ
jgi:LPXTG-motif cell wall-anchored protein